MDYQDRLHDQLAAIREATGHPLTLTHGRWSVHQTRALDVEEAAWLPVDILGAVPRDAAPASKWAARIVALDQITAAAAEIDRLNGPMPRRRAELVHARAVATLAGHREAADAIARSL